MSNDADLLIRCANLRNTLFRFVPGTGSQGSIDRLTFDGQPGYPDAAELITVCLDVWTVVTADQLKGLADLITSGESKYGIFPIMRSVVEHSAWICWILDETSSPLQRVARANLASLNTAGKLNMAASILYGKSSPVAVSAKTRYRQIRNEIRSTFDSVEFDPLSIEGEVFPAPTEIVKHLGNVMGNEDLWLGHYHYLCGMANHPSLSVMEILTLNEFGIHEIDISPERLTQNVRATISPYLRSLLYICAYMRWPDLELRQLYDEISDE